MVWHTAMASPLGEEKWQVEVFKGVVRKQSKQIGFGDGGSPSFPPSADGQTGQAFFARLLKIRPQESHFNLTRSLGVLRTSLIMFLNVRQ